MNDENNVITFCKYPVEGKVKTRIAKTMGNEFAVKLYTMFAEHTFRELLKTDSVFPYLFFYGDDERKKIKEWAGSEFLFEPQEGNELGDKMYNAFKKVIDRGSTKTIIIGTDIPDMSSDIIRKAMQTLDNSDVVIGPSNDGGYYLLGMKKLYRSLFTGIEWSSNSVLRVTLEKVNALNLSYSILPEFIDIDTENDIKKWLSKYSDENNYSLKAAVRSLLLTHLEMK
ncbi:MAG: TIGR04282 family arsenosugar biosynthesis glycosyltransferase [Ignavibacteriaceae bacterium]|jgi:rSAM/selenodomain-associated transferase 1